MNKLTGFEIGLKEKLKKQMEQRPIIFLYILGMVEYKASDKEEQKAPD